MASGTDTTAIKICGLARANDARLAAQLGADFLGLVLAESPRRVALRDARRWVAEIQAEFPDPRWVGVFVRPSKEEVRDAVAALGLDLVQVHGLRPEEGFASPVPWIRAVPASDLRAEEVPGGSEEMPAAPAAGPWALLVDSAGAGGSGGTGQSFDWNLLRDWKERSRVGAAGPRPNLLFLAGGLGPDNVREAIRIVRPYAVDASSRLEASAGRKDHQALREFVRAVRDSDTPPGN